jgi:hypothetical protein
METLSIEERSKRLQEACAHLPTGIKPRELARHILESGDEYTVIEQWLALNYLGCFACYESERLIREFEKVHGVL